MNIKGMVTAYSKAKNAHKWDHHDRSTTLGASEVFHCLRQSVYKKSGIPQDPEHVDNVGAMERGNLIEQHWIVPALLGNLPDTVKLLWAGDDQRTLVEDRISATPDGLLINQGENIKFIQKQLGHSSIQVTMDIYGHLLPESEQNAPQRLEAAFMPQLAAQETAQRSQNKKSVTIICKFMCSL